MPTSFPLRVQAIRSRGQTPRLYVSFPLALAAAIGLEPGEEVQWELLERGELHLRRPNAPAPVARSKARKQLPAPLITARFGAAAGNRPAFPPAPLRSPSTLTRVRPVPGQALPTQNAEITPRTITMTPNPNDSKAATLTEQAIAGILNAQKRMKSRFA